MATWSKQGLVRLAVVATMFFVYFIAFPQDLAAVVGPIERTLALSNAISPWLYGVVAVSILSCTAVRIWGGRPGRDDRATHTAPPT